LIYNKNEGEEGKIEKLSVALHLLRKICWLANLPLLAQNLMGIRLLLQVTCFELSLAANDLLKELELMDLFLHNLLAHYSHFFHQYSFVRGSTEEGEHIQSFIKQILRHCTDKKKERALNEIFTRLSISLQTRLLFCEEELEQISLPNNRKCNKQFAKFREIIKKQQDIEIFKPAQDDQSMMLNLRIDFSRSYCKENILWNMLKKRRIDSSSTSQPISTH